MISNKFINLNIKQKYGGKKYEIDENKLNLYNRHGIINEGNMCYMNSIIQLIYSLPIMIKYIYEIDTKENKNQKIEFIKQLKLAFSKLNNYNRKISIKSIYKYLDFENGNYNISQDAHEYYTKIFDILSTLNNKIKELAYGIITGKIEVKKKQYSSEKDEEFLFLEVEIEKSHNLNDCLDLFFQTEILKGDNKKEIMENNKKLYFEGTKTYRIKKIPDILHISLKRFKYNEKRHLFNKLNNKIKFK